jgi:hypothetical protein
METSIWGGRGFFQLISNFIIHFETRITNGVPSGGGKCEQINLILEKKLKIFPKFREPKHRNFIFKWGTFFCLLCLKTRNWGGGGGGGGWKNF